MRPAVEAAFASQVMYYEERVKEGECHDVSLRMQSVLVRLILASGLIAAHDTLCAWGKCLRAQFYRDNRGLVMKEKAGLSAQVTVILNKLQEEVKMLRVENDSLHEHMRTMTTQQAALIDHMGTIANAFKKMSLGVGGGSTGSLAVTHDAPAEAPSAAILGARGEAGGGGEAGGSRAIAITGPQVGVMTTTRLTTRRATRRNPSRC